MTVRSLSEHVSAINGLHAYVDGELPPEERRKVEALLARRPGASARVQDYQQQNRLIREHSDSRAEAPLPPAIEAELGRLRTMLEGRGRRARVRALAAPALMAAGIAGLLWLGSDLLLGQRLMPGTADRTQVAAAAERPSADVAFPVPDLGSFGFQLVASRAVGMGPADHRHLIYRDQAGAQVSLYLSDAHGRGDAGGEARNTFLSQGPFSYLFWKHGSRQFGMIGEVDQDLLLAMGQAVDGSGAISSDPAMAPDDRSETAPAAAPPQPQQDGKAGGQLLPYDPTPAQPTSASPTDQPGDQPVGQPSAPDQKDAARTATGPRDTA